MILEFHGDPATEIAEAGSDSRELGPDSLFVAISGSRFNGTEFIPQAINNGATTVITEQPVNAPPGVNLIRVKNAYQAAGIAAEVYHDYPVNKMRTLGITGTNGKTTCSFLLRDILRRNNQKTGLIGTVQYEIGEQILTADRTTPTPFELQKMLRRMADAETAWLVIEISSHALAQKRLGRPRLQGGLFTNLSGDHCDYHLNMENYFLAKQSLFTEHLAPEAPAMINIDDPWGQRLYNRLRDNSSTRPLRFGIDTADSDYRITDVQSSLHGSNFRLTPPAGSDFKLQTAMIGRFNILNLGGVAALAAELNMPIPVIQQSVAAFTGAPGRLEAIPEARAFKVFVDYAHTDDALRNLLTTLRELNPTRLSLVFGCGGDRDREKRPRMGRTAAELAHRIYLTSDNPRSEKPEKIITDIQAGIPEQSDCRVVPDRAQAIRQAISEAVPDEIIVIAGKGHEAWQTAGTQKIPFDDRIEARKALAMSPDLTNM